MRLRWRRGARAFEPGQVVSTKAQELEAAKQILSEVFHVRPADVEVMLLKRLEERNPREESRERFWPATFCVGE